MTPKLNKIELGMDTFNSFKYGKEINFHLIRTDMINEFDTKETLSYELSHINKVNFSQIIEN